MDQHLIHRYRIKPFRDCDALLWKTTSIPKSLAGVLLDEGLHPQQNTSLHIGENLVAVILMSVKSCSVLRSHSEVAEINKRIVVSL